MYWLSNTIGEERKITKREGRNGGGRIKTFTIRYGLALYAAFFGALVLKH